MTKRIVECSTCNKSFEILEKHYKYSKTKRFCCSKECKNILLTTSKEVICEECKVSLVRKQSDITRSKSGLFFCNHSCKAIYENRFRIGELHPNYKGTNYRQLALRQCANPKCIVCGYSNIAILEVHHIDHDRTNNSLENLVFLCPTHHAEVHKGICQLDNTKS